MEKNNFWCKSAFAALLLLLTVYPTVVGAAAGDGALSVINLQVSPQPVIGGSNITIMFQLYNAYSSSLQNVNLQLAASNPIITVSPSSTYLTDSMGTGIFGGYTNQFSYRIKVPSTLATGEYTIDVIANYETAQPSAAGGISELPSQSVMPIGLYVYGAPNVTVKITGVQILSNKEMRVSTQITNIGYTKASDLSIRFLNSTATHVSGLSSLNISELDAGSTLNADVSYNVTGNATIGAGAYSVPVLVSYASDYNITYSKQLNLTSSLVIGQPNIIVQLSNPQPQSLYRGKNQSATLNIENIGVGAAKNLSVTLQSSGGITLLSSINNFFISDLEPGQSVPEPILIGATGTSGANLTVDMQYYPASYEGLISKTQILALSLAPSAQFSVLSQASTLSPGAAAVPVTFIVQNTGTMEADQMQLSLQTTYPITPVAGTAYISALKPGASANVTFVVNVDSQGVTGNYPITMYEQWKQPDGATNQQFSGSNTYFISIRNAESNSVLIIGAIVVVAAVAVIAYKYVSKAKKVQKKKAAA